MSSYDVIRHFKRNLPKGYGKIGHFGTLDPFASGVLLIAIGAATRLNEYVHEHCPKTYLAIGKLGVGSHTGDLTEGISQKDETLFFKNEIANYSLEFIQKQLEKKFMGEYWQAPHKYSAAKFEGKPLHEWAREGVEIEKEKKKRIIYELKVVKYAFPYLSIRFRVSSGTYIRSLFEDCANELGTLGALVSLVREKIGPLHFKDSLKLKDWPTKKGWDYSKHGISPENVLVLDEIKLNEVQSRMYRNGVPLDIKRIECPIQINEMPFWVRSDVGTLIGMGKIREDLLKVVFNYS